MSLIKLDIALKLEDGSTPIARVRLPEQAAYDAHFPEKLSKLVTQMKAMADRAKGQDPNSPTDAQVEFGVDLGYRMCWLAWKALHRAKVTTLDADDFLATIDEWTILDAPGAASPFQSAPPGSGPSSSPSSPGLPPPPGVST